jgi:PIN domain nuclease of toxin-antitoxin system
LAALPPLHKDPFDRIVIAQAVAEGLDFITDDEMISGYQLRTIW